MYLSIVDHNGRKIPAAQLYADGYEGATTGRRLADWGLGSSGPNTSMLNSLSSLRSRQRELVRNNPLAGGGVDVIVSNMIGTGIKPRWQVDDAALKEEIQELWADSVQETDADETSSFYGQQDIVARAMINDGEALARFRYPSPRLGLAVPLQVQVMECDHLDLAHNTLAPNGNEIRMGIELNKAGRRAAYWLYRNHPGDPRLAANTTARLREPAQEVMHTYRPLRAGQLRGLPWFSRIILKLHEIDQCVDAELVRRKTTAMFGGFITRQPDQGFAGGRPNPLGRMDTPDANGSPVIALEPGTFPELPFGMDVKFAQPHDVGGNYVAWMDQQLRDIARGMGITFEQLTGNLEGVNFSSIRSGLLEFRRLMTQVQAFTIVFQFCRPFVSRWMDMAVLSGALRIPDYLENRRKYQRVQWMPDGWDWVDPVKDLKADIMEVRAGFTSRTRKVAERKGADAEIIDREIVADNARNDKLGLVLDSDPRRTSGTGIYQETREETQDE